jgi:hypothetical protein
MRTYVVRQEGSKFRDTVSFRQQSRKDINYYRVRKKQEVTITALSHLTYGINSDLWYGVTVKDLRLAAAISL